MRLGAEENLSNLMMAVLQARKETEDAFQPALQRAA